MTCRSPVRFAARVAGRSASGFLSLVTLVGVALLALLGGLTACESPPPSTAAPSTAATGTTAPSHTGSTAAPGEGTASNSGPPFVAAATWVRGSGGRSLHVRPTAAGRVAQGTGDAAEAWREVVRLAPDADQPGMQAQFDCHWTYARLVEPDKATWNLEPWRPVVSAPELAAAACNPGGPESADG